MRAVRVRARGVLSAHWSLVKASEFMILGLTIDNTGMRGQVRPPFVLAILKLLTCDEYSLTWHRS